MTMFLKKGYERGFTFQKSTSRGGNFFVEVDD